VDHPARPVEECDDHGLNHAQQELHEFVDGRVVVTEGYPVDVSVLKDGSATS
jgi:hypothetical protein